MSNVKINFENSTIIITKAYSQKASKYNSPEYRELVKIKKQNEGFTVVVKTAPKKTSRLNKITLDSMRIYIENHDDAEGTMMAKFEKKLNEKVNDEGDYNTFFDIKSWFLTEYPELKKSVA